jgi:RNA polymerase primary sigma factor
MTNTSDVNPSSEELLQLLQKFLNAADLLTDRQAGMLSMRFGLSGGEPASLAEVGAAYGVSGERARQIIAEAQQVILSAPDVGE